MYSYSREIYSEKIVECGYCGVSVRKKDREIQSKMEGKRNVIVHMILKIINQKEEKCMSFSWKK